MSDANPRSLADRINAMSFKTFAGLGAGTGLLMALLASTTVDKGAAQPSQEVAAKNPEHTDGAMIAVNEDVEDHADDHAPGHGAAGGATPTDEAPAAGEPEAADADAEAEADAEADADAVADAEAEEDAIVVDDERLDLGSAADGDAGDVDGASEDGASAAPSGSADAAAAAARRNAERSAEAEMTPDELLDAAKTAYTEKRYKDAYRLATRSQRAKPRDSAQMLRGRAACRLKDEKNAKEIVRSFKLGDEKRKTLRTFCKERGVRVGL